MYFVLIQHCLLIRLLTGFCKNLYVLLLSQFTSTSRPFKIQTRSQTLNSQLTSAASCFKATRKTYRVPATICVVALIILFNLK